MESWGWRNKCVFLTNEGRKRLKNVAIKDKLGGALLANSVFVWMRVSVVGESVFIMIKCIGQQQICQSCNEE